MTQTVRETKRDAQIQALRTLADWLDANPTVPMPTLRLHRHLQNENDGTEIENLATVRSVAAHLGAELDEYLDDRTVLRYRVGEHLWYELFAWHQNGREQVGELARLRAEVEQLRGLAYSRADDADDPTPVSPARVPLHTGAVTDDGLVEVEPVHMDFTTGASMCGLAPTTPHEGSLLWADVTCEACRKAAS